MKLKAVSGITLILLLIGMLTLASNIQLVKSDPRTWIVDDDRPADFSKIQNAINAASPGDTIFVRTGTYYEYVVVNKTVSLIGENRSTTIIDGNWDPIVVRLSANNVKIAGFTIRRGIKGITTQFTMSNGNIISDNTIDMISYGIILFDSYNNTFSGNIVHEANVYGIDILGGGGHTICGNDISGVGVGDAGVTVESNDNIFGANNITNHFEGISLVSGSNNTFIGNTITSNTYGVWMIFESSNNTFYHNNFIDNNVQALSGSFNTWNDDYPSGGNYWSDYSGVDVKSGPNQDQPSSDGIGDKTYVIDASNQDHYPLMYPWGAPPPPSYTLTVYSSPTGVTFTVDGVSRTTPWSGTYSEGASVSLVMPETYNGYVWSHWQEDGDPNRIKTVTIDTDITLTGVFTSAPVGGKATPINIPANKPETPALWIWLSTIILPLIATAVFVKLKKKKQ